MSIAKLVILALILSSCGLNKMVNQYDNVRYNIDPKTLEVHGGNVNLELDATFPEKYFNKMATVEITPVLIDEKGKETSFKSITIQGEEASGGESTIFYETGGGFSYSDKIEYSDDMMVSTLELRATATLKETTTNNSDNKVLGPVIIANGVITTSERVANDEIIAIENHGYEMETILSEDATIYFLVNQSKIRTSEKSDDDVKRLQEFVKNGYVTKSFEIVSYASPEGSVSVNDDISGKRNKSTLKYAKYLLNKLKVNGSDNTDLYQISSIGEDWNGFYKLVGSSNIKDKKIINKIVKSNKTAEEKEQSIRDMAEVYDAVDKNILPFLRKAEITIKSYHPKKTREEIVLFSTTNLSELSVEELLYSATLEENSSNKLTILNSVVSLHNDWRAYNNIACIYLSKNDDDNAMIYLNKAKENGGANESSVLTNLGIIASWNGELNKAQKLFDKANTNSTNQAILDVRQGNYRSATGILRGNSYNAALVSILNGNNNSTCNEETDACYYLNAIAGARLGNETILFTNLEKAIQNSEVYKVEALKDLEFVNYRNNEKFISLTK
ncbi:MAG: DUF3868 domain-containing protein [Flavobacteriales bacterium]|nr:DUF3868 domain-containing protein [Flavobacteriales bacterium]MBT7481765.1 DUF3868 domain-containing protein [Flavobacteriales bacterium]